MNTTTAAIAQIDAIQSAQDDAELALLEQALDALFLGPDPARGIDAMFRVYERFPEDDGYGIFWTMLHGLESLDGYEVRLVESVQRVPMEFNVNMIGRILNAGVFAVGSTQLLDVLRTVEDHPNATAYARELARDIVQRHKTTSPKQS